MCMNQGHPRRTSSLRAFAFVFATALILAGCATETPLAPQDILQHVENAPTESDHRGITAIYEQQAGTARRLLVRASNHLRQKRGFETR